MNSKQANAAKTVIVTGASQGIGAGLVKTFLGRGYNVVANSRSIAKSDAFEAMKGFEKKTPALFTSASIDPNLLLAVGQARIG
jgi:NAD(P)-dependent dehydrogenase (short-subunit alcohol dehydrogenase family)